MSTTFQAFALATGLLAGLAGPVQEPVQAGEAPDAARKEMIEVFHRIEKRLAEIDALLYEAGAGGRLVKTPESGLAGLLESSRGKSREVIEGIDKLMELAQRQQQQQQQQQQQGEQGGQGSPLDRPQQGPTQREQTPEQPAPGSEQQQGQEQKDQPERDKDSLEPGRNKEGERSQRQATGAPQAQDGNERWGDLPVRYRDLFRMEGGSDLPPRYRDWIDAYHRRLNQRP